MSRLEKHALYSIALCTGAFIINLGWAIRSHAWFWIVLTVFWGVVLGIDVKEWRRVRYVRRFREKYPY